MTYCHKQVKTVGIKNSTVMMTQAFSTGVLDVALDKPFSREYDTWPAHIQWHYERGRAYAVLFPNIPLKHGKSLNPTALFHYCKAVYNNDII